MSHPPRENGIQELSNRNYLEYAEAVCLVLAEGRSDPYCDQSYIT